MTIEKLDTAEASLHGLHGVGGLAKEVGIPEHVLVLHHKADECQVRVKNIKLTCLTPHRVKTIVRWKRKINDIM